MSHLTCSAPSRIDLSGGAADIFGKCTLCCAVSLRTYCTVESGTPGIFLEDVPSSLKDLPVVEAALNRLKIPLSFKLTIRSDVPKASGLGGSAALTVALMYGVRRLLRSPVNLYALAEEAQRAETDLGMLNGYQDWYAAAFGGLLFLDFRGKSNREIEDEPYATVENLSQYARDIRFVIADTGVSHSSAVSNETLYNSYMSGDPTIVSSIERLDALTCIGKKAAIHNDTEALSAVVRENQEIIQRFGRSSEENENLIRKAYEGGALACKVTGAGRGGCIAALCSGNKSQRTVHNALLEETTDVFSVSRDRGVGEENHVQDLRL